ncbi:MAG: HD family phosphohydrolase [Paludibacteraceae bacterium]
MALDLTKDKINLFTRIGLFVAVVVIIVLLFPKDKKFKYHYEIGKPWTYELITASFDFPIYKTDDQLKADKEELLSTYTPYFQYDDQISRHQLNKWLTDWQSKNAEQPKYYSYVERKFNDIYQKGVISSGEYDRLITNKRKNIAIVHKDRRTDIITVEDIYTPKSAYEEIILDKPEYISISDLNSYNLNLYLIDNLRYDSITSQAVKEDMVKNLSLTSGMIQTGERIIDRVEIVTPITYSILNSMKIETQKRNSAFKESIYVIFGELIIVLGLILLLTLYLFLFRSNIFESLNNLLFIALMILFTVGLTSIILNFTSMGVYVVPFTMLPIIIRVFFDSRTALFTHIIAILIISFMVDNPFVFIVLQIMAGMTAVSGLKDLTARSQLTQTAFYIFLCYTITYLATELVSEGELNRIYFLPIVYFGISSAILLFVYVLIYIFEKMFNLISAVTLVELTNINSDLMIKFAELAPGTFQHSLQVSNLATEAAKKIGANSLLVRTGALYHDIGKMLNPQYFIENQVGGKNPLLEMSYEDASQAIIKHVSDGITLARKNGLPDQIIGFISTHHGRTKTKFFYNSFINDNPSMKPREEKFTYPGPLPFSKETAVLMMADAVEARSRTLGEYTEQSISNMVETMIDAQIADGQLKDAPISFKDVETVKIVLSEKIKNIYHSRITYPELQKEEQ